MNKFKMVSSAICGKIDIRLISETKLGSSFPSSQYVTQTWMVTQTYIV